MRRKPYTATGLRRVPCFRCNLKGIFRPSVSQWQICSLNNEYKGVCRECDIKLNQIVLKFMKIPAKEIYCLIEKYKERLSEKI
jgi:hypothetical protein